jgi:hypothetical protein
MLQARREAEHLNPNDILLVVELTTGGRLPSNLFEAAYDHTVRFCSRVVFLLSVVRRNLDPGISQLLTVRAQSMPLSQTCPYTTR